MNKKKLGIIIGAAAAVLAIGAGAYFLLRGGSAEGTAYVESVKNIMSGGTGALLGGRYSGVVEAKQIVKVKLDSDKKLDECFVAVGDRVQEGTPLFSYDVESLSLAYEQLKIDLQGMKNNIATMQDQIADLQKQVKRAKGQTKAELTIQLQTTELSLKKEEYNAKKKQIDVDGAKKVIDDNVVKATVNGTVRSINPPNASDSENTTGETSDTAYITIVAGDDYHVKGTISEQSVRQLVVGTPVILRSRTDEKQIWRGAVESVNTEQAESQQQNMYYYDSSNSGEQTSKYAFYVSLDSRDGLIMGQHLYIEFDVGQEDGGSGVRLPEYYLINEDGRYFVYAANARDRIEKRAVTVGAFSEELGTYEILSGLTEDDRIAFPDETVQPGMAAVDAGYAGESGGAVVTDGADGGDAGIIYDETGGDTGAAYDETGGEVLPGESGAAGGAASDGTVPADGADGADGAAAEPANAG